MRKLEGLKPEKVFRYFEDISAIPRGSGNEEAVSQYCLDFARDHGLAAYRDENNNVVITKEAAKGYENVPGMILQSGCKYMGYRAGKCWRILPMGLVMKCTMNREYWKKEGMDKK